MQEKEQDAKIAFMHASSAAQSSVQQLHSERVLSNASTVPPNSLQLRNIIFSTPTAIHRCSWWGLMDNPQAQMYREQYPVI